MNSKRKAQLRLAVAQRMTRNQLSILALGTGISKEKLAEFVKTGKVDKQDLMILDMMS